METRDEEGKREVDGAEDVSFGQRLSQGRRKTMGIGLELLSTPPRGRARNGFMKGAGVSPEHCAGF